MMQNIKTLKTLSSVKAYRKTIAASDLISLESELSDAQKQIELEQTKLELLYEQIRTKRNNSNISSSESYAQDLNHIETISQSIESWQSKIYQILEEKRTKRVQIVYEMNKEKLYNTLAENKKEINRSINIKNQEQQLQEQWQTYKYKK